MSPRNKKKDSSPKKQQSIKQYFSPSAKSSDGSKKRAREEEPKNQNDKNAVQSPKKRAKEEVRRDPEAVNNNNNAPKESAVNNNNISNNNNNNNNRKEKEVTPEKKSTPKRSRKNAAEPEKKAGKSGSVEKSRKMPTNDIDSEKDQLIIVPDENAEVIVPDKHGGIIACEGNTSNVPGGEGEVIVPHPVGDVIEHEDEGEFIGPDKDGEYTELEVNRDGAGIEKDVSQPQQAKILRPASPVQKEQKVNFKCKVCDQWFPNRYFQRKHMLMEHENQLYECRVCSFNSVNPEKLKSHIIKQHVIKKERSEPVSLDEIKVDLDELMTKQTPRKVMMEDGVALGRDPSNKLCFICAMCDRIYTSKYSLERHVRCHTGEKPYICEVCNFSTSYREHMQRHMTSVHLIVHSDEPKQKYVPKNRRKTEEKNVSTEDEDNEDESNQSKDDSSPNNSIDSSDTVTGNSASAKKRRNILRKRFECAACGLKATHKTDLVNHIKEKHPNAHIESLDNGDGSKVHLIVTVSKKSSVSRRMVITCPDCSKVFHDTWKYKVHKRSHTGVKPFGCSICSFFATSKMTIRDHIHRKHKNIENPKILLRTVCIDGTVDHVELSMPQREFKCDFCQEVFQDNYHLKQHKKRTHQEALPFSCIECGHREWARANIIIHCLQKHSDKELEGLILRKDKPFTVGPHKLPKCQQCDKVFPYQSQLYLHQKQHTGERSFFCDICSYRTNIKAALEKHILKHLEGDPPKKSGGRKRNTKNKPTPECDHPINFVDVDEVTVETPPAEVAKKESLRANKRSSKNNIEPRK